MTTGLKEAASNVPEAASKVPVASSKDVQDENNKTESIDVKLGTSSYCQELVLRLTVQTLTVDASVISI